MDRLSATEKLNDAFAQPTSTPCTWRDDRDTYISEMREQLLSSQIDPIAVIATADIIAQQHFGHDAVARSYFAIARSGETWLLYSQDTGEFAKAFGRSPNALGLLGPASQDALAEWLG